MKLRILDQITETDTRVVKKPDTPEVSLAITDKGATALAWAASFIALFAAAAAVLVALFQRKPDER